MSTLPTGHRYSHIEKSVFLLEPKEQTWGVPDADKVALPEGQTYLALLTQRPIDYLTYRALNPIVSTVSELGFRVLTAGTLSHRLCASTRHVHGNCMGPGL
jgi:hypothetical protein